MLMEDILETKTNKQTSIFKILLKKNFEFLKFIDNL